MQAVPKKQTFELIAQARATVSHAKQAADDLNKVRSEVRETVEYFKWLRFLGYDPHAIDFLEKLDMRQ